jgi:hypothetical protein
VPRPRTLIASRGHLIGSLTVHRQQAERKAPRESARFGSQSAGNAGAMRFALIGLLIAAVIFLASGGHVLFLPLFFLLPMGGLFGHRRRRRRF